MTIQELLESMKNEGGANPGPMELLSQLDESAVFEHANNRKWIFSKTAIPANYKMLMSIAVAAALGESNCIKTYVRGAKQKGVSKDEIAEALMLARFVKATTVFSASVDAMRYLVEVAPKDN